MKTKKLPVRDTHTLRLLRDLYAEMVCVITEARTRRMRTGPVFRTDATRYALRLDAAIHRELKKATR